MFPVFSNRKREVKIAVNLKFYRWFPELSTAYSKLRYGTHRPLPLPVERGAGAHPSLIKLQKASQGPPGSRPGASQSFSQRYERTIRERVAPLLENTTIKKPGKCDPVRYDKKLDKERPGPGYEKPKTGKSGRTDHPLVSHQSVNPVTPDQPVRSIKTTIEGLQEQLIIYVFEPAHMREQEHPTDILSSKDTQSIIKSLPREWRNRTTFKFIPASFLSVMKSQALEKIANEVFLQVG